MVQNGFTSPDEMFKAFMAHRRQEPLTDPDLKRLWEERVLKERREGQPLSFDPVLSPFAPASYTQAPALQETSQEPRQWTLTTMKRCIVTRAEFQYYGSVETVLQHKGFPTKAPEDGSILLSWFDQETGIAYYELARVQDRGELMSYMMTHFQPLDNTGVERLITFEDTETVP